MGFRVCRLGRRDALLRSDRISDLEELVLPCEPFYPDIRRWLSSRVVPGLGEGSRGVLLAYDDDTGLPAGCAVSRKGRDAKLCHVSVAPGFRGKGLGRRLLAASLADLGRAHLTMPESLWEERRGLFMSLGLSSPLRCTRRYRPGDGEVVLLAGA